MTDAKPNPFIELLTKLQGQDVQNYQLFHQLHDAMKLLGISTKMWLDVEELIETTIEVDDTSEEHDHGGMRPENCQVNKLTWAMAVESLVKNSPPLEWWVEPLEYACDADWEDELYSYHAEMRRVLLGHAVDKWIEENKT